MGAKKNPREERESAALIFSPTKLIYTPRQKSEKGEGETKRQEDDTQVFESISQGCASSKKPKLDRQTASNKMDDNLALTKIHKTLNQLFRDRLHGRGRVRRRRETGGGSDLLLSTTKDKGRSVRPWVGCRAGS